MRFYMNKTLFDHVIGGRLPNTKNIASVLVVRERDANNHNMVYEILPASTFDDAVEIVRNRLREGR